jgi:hypothetical protein
MAGQLRVQDVPRASCVWWVGACGCRWVGVHAGPRSHFRACAHLCARVHADVCRSPAATLSCSSTRSTPVMASVTGCSTYTTSSNTIAVCILIHLYCTVQHTHAGFEQPTNTQSPQLSGCTSLTCKRAAGRCLHTLEPIGAASPCNVSAHLLPDLMIAVPLPAPLPNTRTLRGATVDT